MNRYNEIIKMFKSFGYKYTMSSLFRDFFEMLAIAISNQETRYKYDEREERYMQLIKQYHDIRFDLQNIIPLIFEELQENPRDLIGKMFMDLELGNSNKGQFFTPDCISDLMAAITFSNKEEIEQMISKKGYITVNEPTCGGGAMVIAAANQLKKMNISLDNVVFTCQDLDTFCVHACYVQLAILGLNAVVIQGNTLELEWNDHWMTKKFVYDRILNPDFGLVNGEKL